MSYPTVTVMIGGEPLQIPDWDRIQAPERDQLRQLGEQIGYGRCMQILSQIWYEKERAAGRDERTALLASGTACAWCGTDSRTGKKLKKRPAQANAGEKHD